MDYNTKDQALEERLEKLNKDMQLAFALLEERRKVGGFTNLSRSKNLEWLHLGPEVRAAALQAEVERSAEMRKIVEVNTNA